MKKQRFITNRRASGEDQESELLILPDGRILVHNLTQPFAELLHELNPHAEQISSRLSRRSAVKADDACHSLSVHEQCCSVSTLQGVGGPGHAKACTPNL